MLRVSISDLLDERKVVRQVSKASVSGTNLVAIAMAVIIMRRRREYAIAL